jgi:hypothetical protein
MGVRMAYLRTFRLGSGPGSGTVTTILDGTPGATVPVCDAFQLDGIGCLIKPQEAAWVRPLDR